ncbi:MAG: hypothetical protein JO075_11070 [Acidimicrobiia bacterium]|nr:hypothetical protein [Acidimicrobiia bacterium]
METIERTDEEQRRIDLQDLNDHLRTAADLADRIGELARDADRAATALAFAVAEAERLRVLLLETAEVPEPSDAATAEIRERTCTTR